MKKILYSLVILLVIVITVLVYMHVTKKTITVSDDSKNSTVSQLCFYKKQTYGKGLSDVSYVRMTITDTAVSGEYQSIPAEKDKKGGSFVGTITPASQGQRIADVVWKASGEGMTNSEQLRIAVTPTTAQIGFGEMVLQKGTTAMYVYKDVQAITYGDTMKSIECSEL